MTEIRKLYISKFIYGFGCMASYTFTLYFLSNGLDQTQIAILFSVYFIASTLLEIPTGGIADTFGHKTSFALGLMIEAFYYLTFFLFPHFYGFLAGMLIAALGLSLQSGANDSLTYEILIKEGKKKDYLKIGGKISAMMSLAVIIAAPIGTTIYKFYPKVPYLISFALVFISGIVIYFVKYEFTDIVPTASNYLKQLNTGVKLALNNKRLMMLFIIGIVTLTSSYIFDGNIAAPLQLNLGVDIAFLGIVQSMIAIGYMIVSLYTYKLVEKIGNVNALFVSLVASSLCFFVLSRINYFYGISFIVAYFMTHGFRCNILNNLQQEEATSGQRSTIASAGSTIKNLGAAAMLPLWGLYIDFSGINSTLVALGVFVLVFGFIGTLLYNKSIK